jgi:hypothetical protein
MEDPFLREPRINTVFSHIKDVEIAKFIIGVSYLEKASLDQVSVVGIDENIASLRIFMKEMILDAGDPKIEFIDEDREFVFSQIAYDFKIFGLKDPHTDLKNDP